MYVAKPPYLSVALCWCLGNPPPILIWPSPPVAKTWVQTNSLIDGIARPWAYGAAANEVLAKQKVGRQGVVLP